MPRRLTLLLVIAGLLLAMVAACDDDDSEVPEDIDISDELPADWPDDFPGYPGAELEGVVISTEEGAAGTVATYQTDDAVADVIAFYDDAFEVGPWVNTGDPEIQPDNALFLIQHEDGGNEGSSVTVVEEDGNTAIVVLLAADAS